MGSLAGMLQEGTEGERAKLVPLHSMCPLGARTKLLTPSCRVSEIEWVYKLLKV